MSVTNPIHHLEDLAMADLIQQAAQQHLEHPQQGDLAQLERVLSHQPRQQRGSEQEQLSQDIRARKHHLNLHSQKFEETS